MIKKALMLFLIIAIASMVYYLSWFAFRWSELPGAIILFRGWPWSNYWLMDIKIDSTIFGPRKYVDSLVLSLCFAFNLTGFIVAIQQIKKLFQK